MRTLVDYVIGAALLVAIAYILLAPSIDSMRVGLQSMIDALK